MAANLLTLARLSALAVTILLLIWSIGFRSGFLHLSSTSSSLPTVHLDHLFSVLHPLLMVMGFILLSGEAILAYRWMRRWSRGARKLMHLAMQGVALGFGVLGIWAKFKGNVGIMNNFYSLHSWMGLACLFLFSAQWIAGFMSFWHHSEGRRTRTIVLPWHVFVGLYTYILAVATAETGLLEKLTFLQTKHGMPRRSAETTLVNCLGFGLVLLGSFVVFTAISPKQHLHVQHLASIKNTNTGNLCSSSNKNGYHSSHQSSKIMSFSDFDNEK
ncbi:Ascorbate ferrireductase (transmembrane) protein [Dioscorea alata]|uniref:Ascorbate ferrireductase (Transmembrane) protein n=1 Tax=Dioscorea alata TaxID=55571 RepID=A0ACB7TSS5_DIOAL|nr:Ascorbate ferrireductase (transmembrane) protein [Dioscorea alata]